MGIEIDCLSFHLTIGYQQEKIFQHKIIEISAHSYCVAASLRSFPYKSCFLSNYIIKLLTILFEDGTTVLTDFCGTISACVGGMCVF